MSSAGLAAAAGLTQEQIDRGLERIFGMGYMVEAVDKKTREPVKTMGPMTERKAEKVERGLLMNLDDENYYVQTVKVTNDPENTDLDDTQPMSRDDV